MHDNKRTHTCEIENLHNNFILLFIHILVLFLSFCLSIEIYDEMKQERRK